ncbi:MULTISPECIES: aminotransferase family protein [Streptomyces]|uniref:Aminotransferase class III-fold pyridoxal phosphate-dependent enzyme n=1 Tax=Streptomyces edwardsiae TaxID=3075527 RepID=A0ABU2QE10_9ACTN|nr:MULTISPECIES: aminotransferase class III-fold pyridoxal phosphate-dependent enzyme [unclassified Streptomyces]MDT0402698.1 aminotransferase class III-fold pyridoxal phosphate-dependent enzyme [Streptomyces sp. DSM 41635]
MTDRGGGLLHGDWSGTWPVARGGEGVYLYDRDGRRFLDAVGGAHVVTIGHGVGEIADAMAAQARKLAYASSRTWVNDPQMELAELIRSRTPEGLGWVYFTSSGSEAAEMAMQLARQYHLERKEPERHKVIGRWHSYHGGTLGAVGMGGHAVHRERLAPYLPPVRHVVAPQCAHCAFGLSRPSCATRCATDLADTIERAGPETVAAFIAEPIGGTTSGAVEPPPGYYETVRSICDAYGILFIADEVVTGFGRTGKDFAIQHWDAAPDMILCSKGLTSGYAPLGAVVVHERVADAIRAGTGNVSLRMTYSGHPVSCAAGLAVQRHIADHGLVERCASAGERLKERLTAMGEASAFVSEVRGRGLLLAVELAAEPDRGVAFPRAERVQERVVAEAFRRGMLLMGGSGTADSPDGDHLLVSPPFVLTEAEGELLVELLEQSITAALAG